MQTRIYDTGMRTDFAVTVRHAQGHWELARADNVNWNLTGCTFGPKYNGSGANHGPHVLLSNEQAQHYAEHVAKLWNAARVPLDLVTVAYIAIGVHAAIRDLDPADTERLQARKDEGHGEDGIIADAVSHAQLLDNLCEELAPDGLSCVWAYEVAEPFGAAWLRAYIDRAEFDPRAVGAALIKEHI